jgi:hypothetical protein
MAPSAAAEPSAAPTSSIVPIRVDVLSEDKTLRIVDTLLFDPTCWPVSLYHPLHVAVEENVTQLAHTILSDAEVQVSVHAIQPWRIFVVDFYCCGFVAFDERTIANE